MGNVSAWIKIGGQIKDAEALAEAIIDEHLANAYCGSVFDEVDDVLDHISKHGKSGCQFYKNQTSGDFEALRQVCEAQGLSYDEEWDGDYEYGAGGVIFTPEKGHVFFSLACPGGSAALTSEQLKTFKTIDEARLHLHWIDTFNPGDLVLPDPLTQAITKARRQNEEA